MLRYVEANPLRAGQAKRAGEYRWSSFGAHGEGRPDALLDRVLRTSGPDPDLIPICDKVNGLAE